MSGQHSVNFLPHGAADLAVEAERCCAAARALEEVEDFTNARYALGVFYAADEVLLELLPEAVRAEAWLRTGSLLRRVGGRDADGEELERAKVYLLKALEIFQARGHKEKVAETLIALAACYWGLGINIKSRQLLGDSVFTEIADPVLQANRLYMLALVARSEMSYPEAVYLLREVVSSCEHIGTPALTCKYRGALGNALLLLGEKEKNPEYTNEALLYYALSSQDAEEAGNIRYAGFIQNNVGYIFFKHGRFDEAHEHIGRARRIFEKLHDVSCVAQTDETRAQVLNAQGRHHEAITILRKSIQTFEITGQAAQQAEALLTLSAALVGTGQPDEGERCAARAAELYALNEIAVGEGNAYLALAEILAVQQPPPLPKLLQSFVRATRLLASDKDVKVVARIDKIEQRILELSGHVRIRQAPSIELVRQPTVGGALWDEGLTLEEAQGRVEEWYLARLVLEGGTLESIAGELSITPEGVRQKLLRYPHLRLLRKAMRDSRVRPLSTRRRRRPLTEIRLDVDDQHLSKLGPCGGDLIGVESCDTLATCELGAIEYEGTDYIGFYDAAGDVPTLYSGCEGYPPLPLRGESVRVIGRVVGYWRRGEEGQRMRRIKKN